MNCDTWVSKFMGLIYPWHRSGLCSHYLYPTNIGATQLQAPGFNRLPCLLGRGHPRPSWTLPSCGILFRNIIQDRRGEKLLGAEEQLCYICECDVDQAPPPAICRGKWSSSAAPAAPFKRPAPPIFRNGEERRGDVGETDDKYNNTNDLLRQITNYHPMVSSSRSRSAPPVIGSSLNNDKLED